MVRFRALDIEKSAERRAFLQSVVGGIVRRGVDAAVAPTELLQDFDVAFLSSDRNSVQGLLSRYSNLGPEVSAESNFGEGVIQTAWQNRVRVSISSQGFIRIGNRYVKKDELASPDPYKRSFQIQATLEKGQLVVWVDARTRIMRKLGESDIDEADSMGDESEVRVRVLPYWIGGLLVGKTGKDASQMEFPYGTRMLKIPEYWHAKHGIDFVSPSDEMLDVHVPSFGKTLPYPRPCIFSEFKERTKLPENLKKAPDDRVSLASEFVNSYLSGLEFLGEKAGFEGPLTTYALGFRELEFAHHATNVIVGSSKETSISNVHSALKLHGPYASPISGRYIVIHSGKRQQVEQSVKSICSAYQNLRLGSLGPLTSIGDAGFIDTVGEKAADYTSTIAGIRSALMEHKEKLMAILVLPSVYASDIYYKARRQLFEHVFGSNPIPCQSITYESVEKIIKSEKSAYAIAVNTASQCYIKLGGTGSAVWILKEPADSSIQGIQPGTSCYAYHDVSRRAKIKASASAYSALTDSYGRYIATGTKPVGGERLAPSSFYDILVELLQKISIFSQRYGHRPFSRLVFAKDGVVREDEAIMMEDVILNGIPEEDKEPITQLLQRIPMLPKSLIIEIIGVNKSPNKRLFDHVDHYYNVNEGTAVTYDDERGLLVSCSSRAGSAQPIEISLHKHILLNSNVPAPHISQVIEEYYRLTRLNWSSIFRQGKFALPQILTQNLGENISAGVIVPDDMVLL